MVLCSGPFQMGSLNYHIPFCYRRVGQHGSPMPHSFCQRCGGADPLVRAGRPRPAAGTMVSAHRVRQQADGGVGRGPGGPPPQGSLPVSIVYPEKGGAKIMRRYAVVFEKAESNWAAYVPDLPGCITTGSTLQETKHNIREAIELHLEAMLEVGEPIPDPTSDVDFVELQTVDATRRVQLEAAATDSSSAKDSRVPQVSPLRPGTSEASDLESEPSTSDLASPPRQQRTNRLSPF